MVSSFKSLETEPKGVVISASARWCGQARDSLPHAFNLVDNQCKTSLFRHTGIRRPFMS